MMVIAMIEDDNDEFNDSIDNHNMIFNSSSYSY